MVNQIVIHIGLPKTGTTFLQRNLATIDSKLLKRGIKYYYGTKLSSFGEKLGPKVKKILISWEKYSQPFGSEDFLKLIKKCKTIYDVDVANIHILICFREQVSLIESIFTQRIKEGQRFKNINDFINTDLNKYFVYDYREILRFLYDKVEIKTENVQTFWYEHFYECGIRVFFNWFSKNAGLGIEIPVVYKGSRSYNSGLLKTQVEDLLSKKCDVNRLALEDKNKGIKMYMKGFIDVESANEIRERCRESNVELGLDYEIFDKINSKY